MRSGSPSRSLRPALKTAHNWIGLIAGIVICVISLAGSVTVFRYDVRDAQLPKRSSASGSGQIASLDEVTKQVALVRAGAPITKILFPAKAGDPLIVDVGTEGKPEHLVVDAATAQVLGVVDTGWMDWFIDLHRNLLSGKTGRSAVGVIGITLFILSITGVLLWVYGARNWRSWISVRAQGSSRRFHFELHRAVGLWACAFLTVASFTGVGLAFPDAFRQSLAWMTREPMGNEARKMAGGKKKSKRESKTELMPLSDYLRNGTGAMPDAIPSEMRLPQRGKGVVELRLSRSGDLTPGLNRVYLDQATAAVTSATRAADRPLSAKVFGLFAPIHYAELGGFPLRVLWSLLALTPSLLFVTGLITWWKPKKRAVPKAVREEVLVAQ